MKNFARRERVEITDQRVKAVLMFFYFFEQFLNFQMTLRFAPF